MASASDVPHKYDCLINGQGFLCADIEEIKGQYGFTPTFVPRTNTQGDYGDNFQDFWMTETQRDWTKGEQQRFYRPRSAEDSASRYWDAAAIDRSIPGQASMRKQTPSLGFAASIVGAIGQGGAGTNLFAASSTNLYQVSESGTITDRGAHGAGTFANKEAMAVDSSFNVYIGGASLTRAYSTATTSFSTFSSTAVVALCYLNNTLFGMTGATAGNLVRFDTSGNDTEIYEWQTASGAQLGTRSQLRAYGSKLLISRRSGDRGAELWVYDGSGVSRIAVFPPNFILNSLEVVNGVAYVGGAFIESTSAYRAAVYFYANGVYDVLWKSNSTYATEVYASVTAYQGGVVIADEPESSLLFFDPITGGVSTLGAYTVAGNGVDTMIAAGKATLLLTNGTATTYYYHGGGTTATSSTITSSLFDFDSSLDKIFRGIKVEFNAGSDGNGGSVDIAYRVNDLDGSYTTLQTGATSGTEYELSGVTGRSISVKVTLNKGTSTNGPVLKRLSVRAVPQQATFRKGTLVLNCTGRDGKQPLQLRDGSFEPKDGLTLAQALNTAATSSTPITITDQFGTITAVIEADGFQIRQVRPNEFIAVVPYREV